MIRIEGWFSSRVDGNAKPAELAFSTSAISVAAFINAGAVDEVLRVFALEALLRLCSAPRAAGEAALVAVASAAAWVTDRCGCAGADFGAHANGSADSISCRGRCQHLVL